jgi:hypothetical protein
LARIRADGVSFVTPATPVAELAALKLLAAKQRSFGRSSFDADHAVRILQARSSAGRLSAHPTRKREPSWL